MISNKSAIKYSSKFSSNSLINYLDVQLHCTLSCEVRGIHLKRTTL